MFGILLYKAWLIEPSFAAKMAPVLLKAIEHGSIEKFFQLNRTNNEKIISGLYAGIEAEELNVRGDGLPRYYAAKAANGMKVAVIPMIGSITKNGDSCSYGMRDYQNVLAKVMSNPSISAVVMHFNNTPGGSHDGTPEMATNIRSYKKKTVSFVDGYAASAHYYMASQTNHIMMNKQTPSEVGSIGSLVVYQNVQNMIAKGELPTMEIIRAPQSYNKALLNDLEPLTDGLRAEINADLRNVVKSFIADVKKGRGERLAGVPNDHEMFTGKMYGAEEAISNGLADSKGSLQDAINKAAELAAAKSTSTRVTQSQVNTEMKFPKLSSLFGKSEKEANADSSAEGLSAEDQASMEAAEKKLADMEALNLTMKADNEAHVKKIAELEAKVTEQSAQVSSLEKEKKELNEKLAKEPAGAKTTVIEEEPKPDNSKYLTSVDAEKKKYATI